MAFARYLLSVIVLGSVHTGNLTYGALEKVDLPYDFDRIPIDTGDEAELAKLDDSNSEQDANDFTDKPRNMKEGLESDQSEPDTDDSTEPAMHEKSDMSAYNEDESSLGAKGGEEGEPDKSYDDDVFIRTLNEEEQVPTNDDESKLTGLDDSELSQATDDLSGRQEDTEKKVGDGLSEDLLVRTIHQARQETDKEDKRTKSSKSEEELQPKTIQEQHYKRYAARLEPARIEALVREKATRILAEKLGILPNDVASKLKTAGSWLHRFANSPKYIRCKRLRRYRTITGVCNNLYHPWYGATDTPFIRILRPAYFDGLSAPRLARGRDGKPANARKVSRMLFQQLDKPSHKLSHMVMIWGQFIDHDTTLGAQPNIDCSSKNCKGLQGECFSIEIPQGDTAFKNRKCIVVKRDVPFPNFFGRPRKQFNLRSAFIDASMVYGDEPKRFASLRDKYDRKLLLVRDNPANTPNKRFTDLLPAMKPREEFCRNPNMRMQPCFRAGDARPNENSGLASLHTIWALEHNRIAKTLKYYNGHYWPDWKVFYEARKVVAAMIQHITYNEFLPLILDYRTRIRYGLVLEKNRFFRGYNKKVNPSIIDAFATAAYRFGHSLIQNEMNRFGKKFHPKITPAIPMNRFADSSFLYDVSKGGIESILRGLAKDNAQQMDSNFVKAVQEQLVRSTGDLSDLPAINIQRAREHGNPGYNQYRKLCGLPKAKTFQDFMVKGIMNNDQVRKLASVYKHPDDVDLFVGGVYEKPVPGGILGETFGCIIARQFRRFRIGDRYWYENYSGYHASAHTGTHAHTGFTYRQLQEIRKTSLARVMCDNGKDIQYMQPRALRLQSRYNHPVNCADSTHIPRVNLAEWQVWKGK